MKTFLITVLVLLLLTFFFLVFRLWHKLWKNYKYLKTKYPVSIWKLPSRNLSLLNDEDRKRTVRLYWQYALTLFVGLVSIVAFSAFVQIYA